jgi:hypothetical protein
MAIDQSDEDIKALTSESPSASTAVPPPPEDKPKRPRRKPNDNPEAMAVYQRIVSAEKDTSQHLLPQELNDYVSAEAPLDANADHSFKEAARESVASQIGAEAARETTATFEEKIERLKALKRSHKTKSKNVKFKVAHKTHGRVRMHIPMGKNNPELLKEVAETFAIIPSIEQIIIKPETGSLVLHYDTKHQTNFDQHLSQRLALDNAHASGHLTEFDMLASKIEREAEFLAQNSETARAVVDFFKKADREIKFATNNVIDLKIALAVAAIGLTIFESGVHTATPIWLTLSIFTFNHFVDLRHPTEQEQEFTNAAPVIFKNAMA